MIINMHVRSLLLGGALAIVALSALAVGNAFLAAGTELDEFRTTTCGSDTASEAIGASIRERQDED